MELNKILKYMNMVSILLVLTVFFAIFIYPLVFVVKKDAGSVTPLKIDETFLEKIETLEDNTVDIAPMSR
jgi:hypothetical protein